MANKKAKLASKRAKKKIAPPRNKASRGRKESQPPSGSCLINLPKVADITFSVEFHKELLKAVKKHNTIMVDASAVERLTSPCVQIVVSASRTLKANNGKLSIKNPSPQAEEAFAMLGLTQQLNEWRVS